MLVDNIRYGFASNSSSTHSILVIEDPKHMPSSVRSEYGGQTFGWDDFTLVNDQDKMRYLAQMVGRSYSQDSREYEIIGELYDEDGYIDHQSKMTLPRNLDFLEAFATYIKRDDVVIAGGNDNSDGHPLENLARDLNWSATHLSGYDKEDGLMACFGASKLKSDGDYWIAFNARNGNKVRFSLLKNPRKTEKARTPELLDIKINQYCPFACAFCSQSSTIEGSHADFNAEAVARAVSALDIFEVALGGGEPTLHPDLPAIIEAFHAHDVCVSLTTRNFTFLRKLSQQPYQKLSAVGVSCHNLLDVVKVAHALESQEDPEGKIRTDVRLHVVVGTMPNEDIIAIIEAAAKYRLSVLLLGFKPVGFGASFPTHDPSGLYDDVMDLLKALHSQESGRWLGHVAIDTQLGASWQEDLHRDGHENFFYTQEGARSGYLDLMTNELRPSSYAPKQFSVTCDMASADTANTLLRAWDIMGVYTPEAHLDAR